MFNKDHIIPDKVLTSSHSLDIEKFFQKIESPLAGYRIDNKLISEIIKEECQKNQLDPRFIITKLQVEQSLLFNKPSKDRLD